MTDQYRLDFESARNHLLARIAGLANVPIMIEGKIVTPGRIQGVIELLSRLVLFSKDRSDQAEIQVVAQVVAIAARIRTRHTVDRRTVQRWRADAEALGVLRVNYKSHGHGGHDWNSYSILRKRIDAIVLAEPMASQPETGPPSFGATHFFGATRVDTMSTLNTEVFKVESILPDSGRARDRPSSGDRFGFEKKNPGRVGTAGEEPNRHDGVP